MASWWAEVIIRPFQGLVKFQGGQPTLNVTQHKVLQPGPANIQFVGSHPSIGSTIVPSPAAVTFAGGQPGVTQGRTLTPSPAAVSFAGGQPVVTATQNKILTPTGAAVSIAGGQPTVTIAFGPVTQMYTSGQLAAVTAAAFPTGWSSLGTGVYVKGIGAGGKGDPGQASVNTSNHPGGAGAAGFDEFFISKATIIAAGSTFNAKYGIGGNDGTATADTVFSVGTLSLKAGGANGSGTPGVCTIAGVTGVTTHSGSAAGANSTVFAGAGGGQSIGLGGFASSGGTPGGNSPTKTGGASGTAAVDAAWLEAGAGGGGGFTDNSGGSSVGGNGGKGGKFGGGGGAAGNGWAAPGSPANGGDGGLQLRWV